jgi:hypothetical protein
MVKRTFIDDLLYTPSYGWKDENEELVIPKTTLVRSVFTDECR